MILYEVFFYNIVFTFPVNFICKINVNVFLFHEDCFERVACSDLSVWHGPDNSFSRTTCPPFLQKPLVLIGCGYVKLQISCCCLLFVFWRVYSFLWSCHLNQHSERQTWKVHYKLKERYRTGKKQKSWGSQIYMKLQWWS